MHRLSSLWLAVLILSSYTQGLSIDRRHAGQVKVQGSAHTLRQRGVLLKRNPRGELTDHTRYSDLGNTPLLRLNRKASKSDIRRSYTEMLRRDYTQEQYSLADFPKNWRILKIGLTRLTRNITLTQTELKELEKNITKLILQGDELAHENRTESQLKNTHRRFRAFLKNARFVLPDLDREVQVQTEFVDDIGAEVNSVRNILLRQQAYQDAKAEADSEMQNVGHKIGNKEHNSSRLTLGGRQAAFGNLVEKYLQSTASRDSHNTVAEIDALSDSIEPFEDPELRRADRLIDDALHHRKAFSDDDIHHRKLGFSHAHHHRTKRSDEDIHQGKLGPSHAHHQRTKRSYDDTPSRNERKSQQKVNKQRRKRLNSAYKVDEKTLRKFALISDDPRFQHERRIQRERRKKLNSDYWTDEKAIRDFILQSDGPKLEHPFLQHRKTQLGPTRDIHSLVHRYYRDRQHDTLQHDLEKVYADRNENDLGKTLNTLQNARDRIAMKAKEFYMMDPENTKKYRQLKRELDATTKALEKMSDTVNQQVSEQQLEQLERSQNIAKVMDGALGSRLHDELQTLNMRMRDLRDAARARKQLKPHKKSLQKKINTALEKNLRRLDKYQRKRYKSYLKGTKGARKYRAKLMKNRIRQLNKQLRKANRGKDIEAKRLRILMVQHQLEDILGAREGIVDAPTGFLKLHYDDPYFREDIYPAYKNYRYPKYVGIRKRDYVSPAYYNY